MGSRKRKLDEITEALKQSNSQRDMMTSLDNELSSMVKKMKPTTFIQSDHSTTLQQLSVRAPDQRDHENDEKNSINRISNETEEYSCSMRNAIVRSTENWIKQEQILEASSESSVEGAISASPTLNNNINDDATKQFSDDKKSIYRGLYPINEVKSYFKKQISKNGEKLYICLWPGCNFQTRKYSQHISRHIFLKHKGIKKLECTVGGCSKVFKRPESLVQHVKNHNCGFGIDSNTMKDPKNVCGVRNIKRYFIKFLDNDIDVFQCKYSGCKFVTNNSGSIRRHVHNQHVCPYSSPGSASNINNRFRSNNNSESLISSSHVKNIEDAKSSDYESTIFNYDESTDANMVEVQLNEFDGQSYNPINKCIEQMKPNQDCEKNLFLSGPVDFSKHRYSNSTNLDEEENLNKSIDTEKDDSCSSAINSDQKESSDDEISLKIDECEETAQNSNGMYSLKNHRDRFEKIRKEDSSFFKCKKCSFETKSQVKLIRHFWNESDVKKFPCEKCGSVFESEFSRYKHQKNEHRSITPPEPNFNFQENQSPHQNFFENNIAGHQIVESTTSESQIKTLLNELPNNLNNSQILEFFRNFMFNENQAQLAQQTILPPKFMVSSTNFSSDTFSQHLFSNQDNGGQPASSLLSLLQSPIGSSNQQTLTTINYFNNESNVSQKTSPNQVSQFFEKFKNENGAQHYRCIICENYVVRNYSSITNHVRKMHNKTNNENEQLLSKNLNKLPSLNMDQNFSTKATIQQDNDLNDFDSNNIDCDLSDRMSPTRKGRDKTGLYSLKKFSSYFCRKKTVDGYQYECTCCNEYITKSQASMVRHIWGHFPQDFTCTICNAKCENEFALYKHKKTSHPEHTSQHNRTKSSTNLKKISQISSYQQQSSSTNDPTFNVDLDPESNPLELNPQVFQNHLNKMEPLEEEQFDDKVAEKIDFSVESSSQQQIIANKQSGTTSRRSLQFKKYKYPPMETRENKINENDDESDKGSLLIDDSDQTSEEGKKFQEK